MRWIPGLLEEQLVLVYLLDGLHYSAQQYILNPKSMKFPPSLKENRMLTLCFNELINYSY